MHVEQEFPAHSLMRIENQIQTKHIFIDLKNKSTNIIFFQLKKSYEKLKT
jgi:hypothetical protein